MSRTASPRKFLFDRSFDDPSKLYLPGERRRSEIEAEEALKAEERATREADKAKAAAQKAKAAEPVEKLEFTQAQMDAMREEGYIAGHGAALEEAATAREHYAADALNMIAQALSDLDAKQTDANAEVADFAMRMVYGMARRLLPAYTHAHAVDNIETFVRKVLPLALGEPRLVVRSHPMIAEDLETRLQDVFARAGFQGAFSVVTDYEVQPGDCRLEWDGGGADRDEARIWNDIREIIAANVGDVDVDALDAAADAAAAAPAESEGEHSEAAVPQDDAAPASEIESETQNEDEPAPPPADGAS